MKFLIENLEFKSVFAKLNPAFSSSGHIRLRPGADGGRRGCAGQRDDVSGHDQVGRLLILIFMVSSEMINKYSLGRQLIPKVL